MQWVEDKLVPVFERKYLGKKMVLLADNAPYHHKRVIGSLTSLSKKKIVEMMVEHKVETIDLPINNKRMELLDTDDSETEDRGECIWIPFCPDEQLLRAGVGHPRVANVDELMVAFVEYLRDNKPAMLECTVEKYLQDRGHKELWTPTYCPDLQPIELYWAAGKNHAALNYFLGRTMKQTVSQVRERWHGNHWDVSVGHSDRKEGVNCNKLFRMSLDFAATKFIPLWTIGTLVVNGGDYT
jgi:hypothetical protein